MRTHRPVLSGEPLDLGLEFAFVFVVGFERGVIVATFARGELRTP